MTRRQHIFFRDAFLKRKCTRFDIGSYSRNNAQPREYRMSGNLMKTRWRVPDKEVIITNNEVGYCLLDSRWLLPTVHWHLLHVNQHFQHETRYYLRKNMVK
jgi:hypothetical protein